MREIAVRCVGIYIGVVPLPVELDKIPGVRQIRIVHDHALDVHHLHEEPERRCVADADGLVIFKHTVGVLDLAPRVGDNGQRAVVKADVRAHPLVNGELFFVVAHTVCDDLIEHALCHVERFLIRVGQLGAIARLIRVGYLRRRLYDIVASDVDVIFLRDILGIVHGRRVLERLDLQHREHIQCQQQNQHHRRYYIHYSYKLSLCHENSSFRILIRLGTEKVPPRNCVV